MDRCQIIKNNQQIKYDEIIEYLKQDNGYWLDNDKWDFVKEVFIGNKINRSRYIDFSSIHNKFLKIEFKFFILYLIKNKLLKKATILHYSHRINPLGNFLDKYFYQINSFNEINMEIFLDKWKLYLMNYVCANETLETASGKFCYISTIIQLITFIKDFYHHREETEKDIWNCLKIPGVMIPASGLKNGGNITLNFTRIPLYYREIVKKYFKTIITKKSFSHCINILTTLDYFFNTFYKIGYTDGFLENLTRTDIENYIFQINNEYKDKNVTYVNKFIAYPRTFLEYIQMAQYSKAPKKEISFLIFEMDIPSREKDTDRLQRIRFIPEPILKQIDNNIMDLDKPEFIPIYILLRETGWRGTDILNLRYDNCIEQIWNSKEQNYNYYLCGEITKTGIAQLKIPIRDKVAEMVKKSVDKAKELSTEENNPKKYLFNTYKGKTKGRPLHKLALLRSIERLIGQKDIRDVNDELYHFRLHSLRHTRAKEYVEQGMGISIVQQILGHRSLQMTVHYATVTENTLYEKWKDTEDLDLFRVNTETHELKQIDLNSEDGANLIRYEYVKKNLDAVRVPFGVCFKPSKMACKQQINHCLTCASFCTTVENIPEYEEEIDHVKKQIEVSERCGRELWAEKNKTYLDLLEKTLEKVKEQKIVHKNGSSREDN